jgi:hypothetical protein
MNKRLILLMLALIGADILEAQVVPFYSAANDRYGYKNEKGMVVTEPKYELAYPLEEGMAAVRMNGLYGYVDKFGREVVAPKYANTWKFIGGYAAVKLGDKYGFIDKEGKEVVLPIYEDAYNHHGTCCYKGMAHVKENGKWKIIQIPPVSGTHRSVPSRFP